MFITLEGPEGSGKTSHIPYLVEYLREKGYTVFPTREPGGTSIGEQIREVIHDLKNAEMHPRTETLLYQAARAQIVEEVIRPRLKAGEIVLSDRYADSTIAYQGYGHQQDIEQVRALINYATGGLVPDLTILLDLDVEVGLKRKQESRRVEPPGCLHGRVPPACARRLSGDGEAGAGALGGDRCGVGWDAVQEELRKVIIKSLPEISR